MDLARAKREAPFNIYSFLKENIKSSNTGDKVKTTRMVKTTIHLISNKTTLHMQNLFLYIKSLFGENVCVPVHSVFFTAPHFHLGRRQHFSFFHRRYIIFMFLFRRNWAPLLFISNSSSFPVIQVNVDIKIKWKERLVLVLFLSLSLSVFSS